MEGMGFEPITAVHGIDYAIIYFTEIHKKVYERFWSKYR